MNLSKCAKKLLLFLLLLSLPPVVFAQKMIKGEVNLTIYSFTHAENFPCGAGYGDIMRIDLEVIGDIIDTESIMFKAWLDTPSNQNSPDLLIEYPTEISTKNGQYFVEYLGQGLAGDLNFRLVSTIAKVEPSLKATNTNCLGVATIIITGLLMPNEVPTPMFGNCLVYYDVWLSNIYCMSNSFNYTMPGYGSLADNGECFQSTTPSRLGKEQIAKGQNPFYNNLKVDVRPAVEELVFMNLKGQVLFRKKVNGETTISIPTENLPAGVYLLTAVSADELETQKLIKG